MNKRQNKNTHPRFLQKNKEKKSVKTLKSGCLKKKISKNRLLRLYKITSNGSSSIRTPLLKLKNKKRN